MTAVRKIPSACISLAFAKEQSLGVLPSNPPWRLLDPSSYPGEFGAVVEYVEPETVGGGRADEAGKPAGKDVSVNIEVYLRQDELQVFLPGVFVNHPIETGNTNSLRPTSTSATLANVTSTRFNGTNFTEANGWKKESNANQLVVGTGFAQSANNGLHEITAMTATSLTAAGLEAEATPTGTLEACGYVQNGTTKAQISQTGNRVTLTIDGLGDGAAGEVQPGTFIHVGGDPTTSQFTSGGSPVNTGWARVIDNTATTVICDLTTFEYTAAPSNTNNIQVFVPTRVFKDNIQCDDSFVSTYAFEQRLGKADTTYPHEQSRLVSGALPNTLELSLPNKAEAKVTMSFMATESERRLGDTNDTAPWSGAGRLPTDQTSLYNTSFDIKFGQLYRHDSTTTHRRRLFGLVSDGSVSISNNCEALTGWGVYGAWDINLGKLMIDANFNALFTTVEALDLAEEGIPAGVFIVLARGTSGIVVDIPRVTVQASPVDIQVNQPLRVSITNKGNKSALGYAMSWQYFDYLPRIATGYKYVA